MRRNSLNIVDRVVSEEIKKRIFSLKNKIFENKDMKKGMCSECGSGKMYEGECSECGYNENELKENKKNSGMCSECGSKKMYEGECSECGYTEGEIGESKKLSKGQKYIARQADPKDKIDANDFKKLRGKKTETKEGSKPDFLDLDKDGNKKESMKSASKQVKNKKLKESFRYKIVLDESTKEVFYFDEGEIINIIENIVLEEKKKSKKTTKTLNVTKDAQSKSKKENDDYIDSVVKKMKDYLKMGSKGGYEMKPKHFPKGNGELAEMGKKAYVPSSAVEEYIENFTAAALENLDYDDIKPNEKWVEDNLVGSSRTGNNPEWANAVETEVGERRNKIRKDNLLGKIKKKAYNKSPQPVNDEAGENADKASKILMKLESTENKVILEDIEKIKNLIDYGKKTQ
jgi:hypothetical protein